MSLRRSDRAFAAVSKEARVSVACASSWISFSAPASRSARSASILSRSAGKPSTATEYLRAAALRAKSRSSTCSSTRGSKSISRMAWSMPSCARAKLLSASSIALQTGSRRCGASGILRSKRRTRLASVGTGEPFPDRSSPASFTSPAIFSDFIMIARRSASSSSSPGCGSNLVSSATDERR